MYVIFLCIFFFWRIIKRRNKRQTDFFPLLLGWQAVNAQNLFSGHLKPNHSLRGFYYIGYLYFWANYQTFSLLENSSLNSPVFLKTRFFMVTALPWCLILFLSDQPSYQNSLEFMSPSNPLLLVLRCYRGSP